MVGKIEKPPRCGKRKQQQFPPTLILQNPTLLISTVVEASEVG
jgi:hypothetical protein